MIVRVLPATAGPAFWLNRTVAVTWGWTVMRPIGPTPDGSVAGVGNARWVISLARASEATCWVGPAEDQLSLPNVSCVEPDGPRSPDSRLMPVMFSIACRSFALIRTGATWVGA